MIKGKLKGWTVSLKEALMGAGGADDGGALGKIMAIGTVMARLLIKMLR